MWLLLCLGSPAHAVTLVVDKLVGPYVFVADALAAAAPGDVIEIHPGSYRERVSITVDQLVIRGTDRQGVRLEAMDLFAPADGFLVADGVTLEIEDLTMSGANAFRALRIRNGAEVTMRRVDLENGGFLGSGSLVHVDPTSSLVLDDALVQNGSSGSGRGGLLAVDGAFTAAHTTFTGGTSLTDGGALYCGPTATCQVDDSWFQANTAELGGAVHLDGPLPGPWRRNVFCANVATEDGGAVYQQTDAVHENSVFQDNVATLGGGAIHGFGALDLVNVDLLGNTADAGAAVYVQQGASSLSVRNSLVAYNAPPAVYALYDGPGTAVIEYTAFDANTPLLECNTALGAGCQPEGSATPLIGYVAGDCTGTSVRPGPGSSLLDAGDPALPDPDGTPNDVGSTGGPNACNRAEVIADGIDQDCDAGDLCYVDDDGDGRGEPGAGTVESEDLDCLDPGESADESDVCPGHDDLADCDADGIPDGCDEPCPGPTGDTGAAATDTGGGGTPTGGDTGAPPVDPTADTGGAEEPPPDTTPDPPGDDDDRGCGCASRPRGSALTAVLTAVARRPKP